MRIPMALIALAISIGGLGVTTTRADEIEALRAVGQQAEGAAEARTARDALVAGGTKNLIPILDAFKGSSPLAANWLRSTFEAIVDQQIKAERPLPIKELLDFVADKSASPEARRLAYEWMLKTDPELEKQLIPNMLLDPSPEFRRDAVAKLIDQAKQADETSATAIYRKALQGAVDPDQVKTVATALRNADVEVDLQKHFGFLSDWKVIGPFDNRDKKGFPVAYPPEKSPGKSIDLSAQYDGQLGRVSWQSLSTDDDYGLVDIANQIENYKGSLMYATTVYHSGKDQSVEVRLGTPNAWKLWVNGKLVFEREEYHRGTRMDQYKVAVNFDKGPNRILLKVCQNEQEDSWAQRYQFQFRVCDSTGSAVLPAAATDDLSNNTQGAR